MLADKIRQKLTEHPQKGLIHLPYRYAQSLQGALEHPRLLFHTNKDKLQKLAEFKASEDKVFVCSGLYEGLDLPYDAARWQILGKVPYASLGDARIKAKFDIDKEWYDWEALKKLIQASGRASRAADDYSITYIFDRAFERLLQNDRARQYPLIPQYFQESIVT